MFIQKNNPFSKRNIKVSTTGYKRDSADVNEDELLIPSGEITMKGVDFPVKGEDNLGNVKMMQPGKDYSFPGSKVLETPVKKYKKTKKKR